MLVSLLHKGLDTRFSYTRDFLSETLYFDKGIKEKISYNDPTTEYKQQFFIWYLLSDTVCARELVTSRDLHSIEWWQLVVDLTVGKVDD